MNEQAKKSNLGLILAAGAGVLLAILGVGWGLSERAGRKGAEARAELAAAELADAETRLRKAQAVADRKADAVSEQLRKGADATARRASQLETDLAHARASVTDTKRLLAGASKKQKELEQTLAAAMKAREVARAALAVAKDASGEDARHARGQAEKKYAALAAELKKQEAAAATAKTKAANVETRLLASQAALVLLKAELKKARGEEGKDKTDLTKLLEHANYLTAQNKQLTAANQDLEDREKRLERRNKSLKNEVKALEREIKKLK